jgi:hypothetical protein
MLKPGTGSSAVRGGWARRRQTKGVVEAVHNRLDEVLGIAWGQRFLAIFAERIAATCSFVGLGNLLCPLAEATIWTHEIGHVIGLVDNGIAMVNDHRDPDHGAHDVSEESIMYWAYDGAGVMEVLQGRILGNDAEVIPWGTECLRDLAAVRGN